MISGMEVNHAEEEEDILGFNFMHQQEINSLPYTSVLIDTRSTVSVFKNKEALPEADLRCVHTQMEDSRTQSYKVTYQVFLKCGTTRVAW